eukprot:GILI01032092.1.p1 GENE.GILI01032092.1~~GILI01032092.1.p1  ORF type:complete len:154 (+),score=26.05 GILI01032092.1:50-463(+)
MSVDPSKVHHEIVRSNAQWQFTLYAMAAGMFGGLSGGVGKMSVSDTYTLGIIVRILFFAANGVCTAQMWRYFLKALSLGPTPVCQVINTGTNFAVSALLGILFFGEEITAMWLAGAAMVVAGLAIIATDPNIPMTSN